MPISLEAQAQAQRETACGVALAKTVVEAYVHVFLELPAVAYAEVGQHVVGAYGAELAESQES